MKITTRLTYEKIRFDAPKELHLLVELQAPPLDAGSRRPPVCVLPVIDVSGSMQGAKLHYAKESVSRLVDHLGLGDHCGLVIFSDDVATVSPPVELTLERKAALKAAIAQLQPRASTNLAGGMVEGLRLANDRRLPEGLPRRVILFTDGLANVGPATKHAEILALLAEHRGVATLSAFGYGADADQELLRDLASKGSGNYAFVREPKDALDAFARELGGLLSVHARDIALEVRPGPGARLTDVVSDVDSDAIEGGAVRIAVPELLCEEQRQLVIALTVAPSGAPGTSRVVEVTGTCRVVDAASGASREERFSAAAEVQHVAAGQEQREPTREVDEAVAVAQVVRAQIEAQEQARRGDYAGARARMERVGVVLHQRGLHVQADAAALVAGAVGDEASYDRSAAMRSSLRSKFTRSVSGMADSAVEELVERSGRRTKTSRQSMMEDAFKAPEPEKAPARSRPRTTPSLERKRSKRS